MKEKNAANLTVERAVRPLPRELAALRTANSYMS